MGILKKLLGWEDTDTEKKREEERKKRIKAQKRFKKGQHRKGK